MLLLRPFSSAESLLQAAEQVWNKLGPEDFKEAFTHHPKIGDLNSLREKFSTSANWAAGEQSSVATASEAVLEELAAGNDRYERKFGFIFIVCASGKTADEMLALLKARLPNDPDTEIKIAAAEQSKITKLRLEKLCR